MDDFAKEFRVDGKQVLAVQHEFENGPVVQWFYRPTGMGTCSIAHEYDNDHEGWKKCADYFNGIDEADAQEVAAMFEKAAEGAG